MTVAGAFDGEVPGLTSDPGPLVVGGTELERGRTGLICGVSGRGTAWGWFRPGGAVGRGRTSAGRGGAAGEVAGVCAANCGRARNRHGATKRPERTRHWSEVFMTRKE